MVKDMKILHLNIERDKHVKKVRKLLDGENPDVACFCEIYEKDAGRMASDFGYGFVFSPLVRTESGGLLGYAILSKVRILEASDIRYDDATSIKIPRVDPAQEMADGNRPENRFSYYYSVLSASLKGGLTVATTHFPVTDHSTPGLEDHVFDEMQDVKEVVKTGNIFGKFLEIIRELPSPLVFTADLNNARGEYMYDALAHELVDLVPRGIESTLDPELHRKKGLKLVVDTIMASPDVKVWDVNIREGVSDHKALVAELEA